MAIRCTMLTLLAATLFGVIACKLAGPPIYALVRLRHETRVEMLTIMQTFGEGACDVAIAEFLSGVYENKDVMEGWRETERDCLEISSHLPTTRNTTLSGWRYLRATRSTSSAVTPST
ncbi:MAG: hypothetical protein BMS9Abin37_3196 [Acidobacteriota bacterium]|nr:MAG: hypothetical protein BMS9Abin37_3196 [Acidobacteriota bacterium]